MPADGRRAARPTASAPCSRSAATTSTYLAGHLVGLGLPFEVIDPPELRAYLRRLGRALAAATRRRPR